MGPTEWGLYQGITHITVTEVFDIKTFKCKKIWLTMWHVKFFSVGGEHFFLKRRARRSKDTEEGKEGT